MQIGMTLNYEDSVPIDVDSNGEDVAEVDSKEANRLTTIRIGKPQATTDGVGKPPKCQRKLTSSVWEHYEFLPPDKEGNLFCKCKKCGQTYPGDSRYETDNLKRHLDNCKRRDVRDIGQLLLQSRSGSLGTLMPPQVNLEGICGDVMKMNLYDNEDGEDQSKSAAGSGFGQNSALVN
ncbi:LOW QUALITY PROTEIN: hypothetical protein Cgig2_007128 [Carnegiea gigantea]|uniref:BED-type domain-containing protein n=1 Tax=Carnegiea gigantea TaxID=171969 RepID=A0A9Q1JYA6_9CARY|nr:LOW QUALITY PROTEIN: hypothetical protein Cgig2_007128 [Carnegiea gigantea]